MVRRLLRMVLFSLKNQLTEQRYTMQTLPLNYLFVRRGTVFGRSDTVNLQILKIVFVKILSFLSRE